MYPTRIFVTPELLPTVLHQESAIQIELKLGTLDYWYIVISIGRKHIRPGFIQELKVSDTMEDEGTNVLETQIETVFNLQLVYQSGAAMRYRVQGDIIYSLSKKSLFVFGKLSEK